jgi:hypothetical protein
MAPYAASLALHSLLSALAIGLFVLIPSIALVARRERLAPALHTPLLAWLLRAARVGLGLLVASGVLLDVTTHGIHRRSLWLRASLVALVCLMVAYTRTRAALRRVQAASGSDGAALRAVERWGWTMCASLALIMVLMRAKP